MTVTVSALSTEVARTYQLGGLDAYGCVPEREVSDGQGMPCRHCLQNIAQGAGYLILAHRPFPDRQPYAETGPIFLCSDPCQRGETTDELPEMLRADTYILRGYANTNRIVYGTGAVTPAVDIIERASTLLGHEDVAYVHLRSASNNCYLARLDLTA